MKRVLVVIAVLGLAGCGSEESADQADELSFYVPQRVTAERAAEYRAVGEPLPTGLPRGRARRFLARVEVGCPLRPRDFRIDGYEVDYRADSVVVTFTGAESSSPDLCLVTRARTVRVDEPIGGRELCDGSSDPPASVVPGGSGGRAAC